MGILYHITKDFFMKKIKLGNIFVKNIIQPFISFNTQISEYKKCFYDPNKINRYGAWKKYWTLGKELGCL